MVTFMHIILSLCRFLEHMQRYAGWYTHWFVEQTQEITAKWYDEPVHKGWISTRDSEPTGGWSGVECGGARCGVPHLTREFRQKFTKSLLTVIGERFYLAFRGDVDNDPNGADAIDAEWIASLPDSLRSILPLMSFSRFTFTTRMCAGGWLIARVSKFPPRKFPR